MGYSLKNTLICSWLGSGTDVSCDLDLRLGILLFLGRVAVHQYVLGSGKVEFDGKDVTVGWVTRVFFGDGEIVAVEGSGDGRLPFGKG